MFKQHVEYYKHLEVNGLQLKLGKYTEADKDGNKKLVIRVVPEIKEGRDYGMEDTININSSKEDVETIESFLIQQCLMTRKQVCGD